MVTKFFSFKQWGFNIQYDGSIIVVINKLLAWLNYKKTTDIITKGINIKNVKGAFQIWKQSITFKAVYWWAYARLNGCVEMYLLVYKAICNLSACKQLVKINWRFFLSVLYSAIF